MNTENTQPAAFVLGIEIYETSRTMRRHFDRRARAMGFTQGQWRVLWKLNSNAGISQVGLADLLDMQPISLTRVLDRMETAGLIERRPDPNDRRAVQLFLTPEAGPILVVLRKIAEEVRATATKDISPEQQAHVIGLLRHMRANFDGVSAEPEPVSTQTFNL